MRASEYRVQHRPADRSRKNRSAHAIACALSNGFPRAVTRELFAKPSDELRRIDRAIHEGYLAIEDVAAGFPVPAQLSLLGEGERDAILLAAARSLTLIVDDHAARQAARFVGVAITGTIGVLVEAKRSQLLTPSLRLILNRLRTAGYWLSDELIDAAAKLAGE